MIPEIGQFALVIALGLTLIQSTVPLVGAHRGIPEWMAVARPAARGQFLFLVIAFACLTYAFINNDFSVRYVAHNSNSLLPLQYRISAVWGAHEGSLLLWALILAGWTTAVTIFSRSIPQAYAARVIAVMGLISIGFLLFILMTSNPFDRLFPIPTDGRDLNPLLQDPGLIIHPPMLYMGYVGFSVAFALAIAALLGGQLDSTWARWSRPWATSAWIFLTIGIMLGSWWAYHELGWGGWWFWDPVENASFMPWLVGTALIHSLAVTEKRGAFKSWTVLLAILAFSLSLLGTFLVRSGVLVSVHAFATDPARGVFILAFLAVVVGGSLMLYAWRAPKVRSTGSFELMSRETFLLMNNVLLVVAMVTILVGTLYPLFLDSLGLGKISVGPPYFSAVFVPLMLPLLFLMGVGPFVRWKQARASELIHRLRWLLAGSVVIGIGIPLVMFGGNSIMVALGIGLSGWLILSALSNLWSHIKRRRPQKTLPDAITGVPRAIYGMTFAHIGIGIFVIGVTFNSAFGVEKDLRMAPGEAVTLAGYTFRFEGSIPTDGPNYRSDKGVVTVTRNDRKIATLHPEKRIYHVQNSPMTEAGIDENLLRDIYVAMGEPLKDGAWGMRVYYKPFVQWIWLGPLFMAFGGILAASDRRYRLKHKLVQREQVAESATTSTAEPETSTGRV